MSDQSNRPPGLPKRQHYVPQLLLRGFTVPGTQQVCVFDKSNDRVFRTAIGNVAAEGGFYDFRVTEGLLTLEPALMRLESDVAPLLDRIRDSRSLATLNDLDRENLALFTIVQLQRTANFRARVAQASADLSARMRQIGIDPNSVVNHREMNGEEAKVVASQLILTAHELVPFLLEKTWLLLEAPPDEFFYLSDNPVALRNARDFGFYGNIGLAVPGIEIYLPISSELTLGWVCASITEEFSAMLQKARRVLAELPISLKETEATIKRCSTYLEAVETGAPIKLSPQNLMFHNALQVRHAERFVFSHADAFALVQRMISDNDRYRSGPRSHVG